jgi:hypothetical protein
MVLRIVSNVIQHITQRPDLGIGITDAMPNGHRKPCSFNDVPHFWLDLAGSPFLATISVFIYGTWMLWRRTLSGLTRPVSYRRPHAAHTALSNTYLAKRPQFTDLRSFMFLLSRSLNKIVVNEIDIPCAETAHRFEF